MSEHGPMRRSQRTGTPFGVVALVLAAIGALVAIVGALLMLGVGRG